MTKLLTTGLLAFAIATSSASALACSGGKGEKKLDRMVEKLELNTNQESQFRIIMQEKHEKMKSHREAQREDTLDQLKGVLTVEQLAEFEEMTNKKHHRKNKNKS